MRFDIVDNLFLLFLLNSGARLIASGFRRRKGIVGLCSVTNQNVASVYLFLLFAGLLADTALPL